MQMMGLRSNKIDGIVDPSSKKGEREIKRTGKSLKAEVLGRAFSQDHERVKKKILDPRGPASRKWNKIFLAACLISAFVDPLFFYLPVVRDNLCIDFEMKLQTVLTIIRSVTDIFYMVHIFVRFRTAYVAPSSRVFGRGELVMDSSKIAKRYLRNGFWIDVFVALPLPQVLTWVVIPNLSGSAIANTRNILRFFIFFQYIPRLLLVFPLSSEIVAVADVETEAAWAGAIYNLILCMLVSHVLGACWYLLSIERLEACWRNTCRTEESCQYSYFDCQKVKDSGRTAWFQSSNITKQCDPNNNQYPFGIYGEAVPDVTSAEFFNKYFYCLFFGLKSLSCLGQNLSTSTYVGEMMFAVLVGILGLVLFALLIGNMQVSFPRYMLFYQCLHLFMPHREFVEVFRNMED